MNRKLIVAGILLALAVGLSACQIFARRGASATLSADDVVNTAAAKTVSAIGTEIAEGKNPELATTASVTPSPDGASLPPTGATTAPISSVATAASASLTATASATSGACTNQASFVRDVSIPDGSVMLPGFVFVKTWELKNTGTCAWDSRYNVVFAKKGSAMEGAAATPILTSGAVKPGDSVQVSVTLRAPAAAGEYAGDWKLRAPDNQVFGTGASAAAPFYVKIKVDDAAAFSFADYTCSAKWSNGAEDLPCPGQSGDSKGYILPAQNPVMEDGSGHEGPGWQVMPQSTGNGLIVGRFQGLVVPEHSDFRATISCQPDAPGCYVHFKITYQVDNGPEEVLGEWNEGNDGNVTNIIKDLNMMGGKSTAFNFYVYVSGAPDQSRAVWFNPQILKN